MMVEVDLLGFFGAELVELDGIKGVFIPEVPNYRFSQQKRIGRRSFPPKASAQLVFFRGRKRNGKRGRDIAKQGIYPEYHDIVLESPEFVSRNPWLAVKYVSTVSQEKADKAESALYNDFERLLND